ncbi:MAG: MucB/RseB C-terminal domain-containing protein [Gammaproteobacteria bacterium]|nr:MucB/RseB C-terminal domain-containing protein [Gammaproteobacteria bacterium]
MRTLARIAGAGMLLMAAVATAAEPALDWLMRMERAARELNYTGVFVYLHGGQMEAMRLAHLYEGGKTRERIFSLNGAAREIISDDEQVWCYLPDKKMGVHELRRAGTRSFPGLLPMELDHLKASYEVEVGGAARVADRPARQLSIRPRDKFRYGYELWADEQSGLLLRADLVGTQGEVLEQYMFTEISVGAGVPEGSVEPRTPRDALEWHGPVSRRPEAPPQTSFRVTSLPPGYMMSSNLTRFVPASAMPVQHIVYSDGIAVISVFVEKWKGDASRQMRGPSRMGAVNVFSTLVDEYQVTAVGEVPAATVKQVALAVVRTH